jgi:hypothetical protein
VSDSHRTAGGASPVAQGVVGAAACGLAAIPLAVVLTLIAGIFGDREGLGEIVSAPFCMRCSARSSGWPWDF